jgi:hypothetical protein
MTPYNINVIICSQKRRCNKIISYTESHTEAYKLRSALKEIGIKAKVTKKPWNDLYHKITVDPGSPAITKDYVSGICRELNLQGIFHIGS